MLSDFPRLADTHLHASKPLPDLPDALLYASRLPQNHRHSLAGFQALQAQLRFPFHATTGFPFLWYSSARMLSFALHRWSQTGPRLAPDWPQTGSNCAEIVGRILGTFPHWPQMVPKLGPNWAKLFPNCSQTVPRHAVARAKARVTGEAYRLTRLTRHSLACCQTSPDSPTRSRMLSDFPRLAGTHLHASKPTARLT